MTRVNLKGIHRVKMRLAGGEVAQYHYAWRGGPRFWRSTDGIPIGSPEYVRAFTQAAAEARPDARQGKRVRDLIIEYEKSPEFQRLAARTRKDYTLWLGRVDDRFGDAPAAVLESPRFRAAALKWRDTWKGRQAQHAIRTLQILIGWAHDRGLITEHRLRGVKTAQLYESDRAEIVWTEADIDAFKQVAGAPVVRALVAAIETGLRPGDLITLSRAHVLPMPGGGRRIRIKTSKRKSWVSIPVTAEMGRIIDQTPADQALILTTARGRPWTVVRLSGQVGAAVKKAEGINKALRLYDARGTAATRLVRAGVDLAGIAAIMGWKPATVAHMLEIYAALEGCTSGEVLVQLEEYKARNKL